MVVPTDGASSISVAVRVRPFTIREASQLTKSDDSVCFLGDGSLAGLPAPNLRTKGLRSVIKVVDDKCLVFDPPEDNPVQRFSKTCLPQGKRVKDQTFAFDRVFDENTTQDDVYEGTTRGLLDNVLDGYNATVFAYGATGCGKTHTITGTVQQPGIVFLTMQELFDKMREREEEKVIELSLSYLEIYNETIRDLLVPGGSKQGLMLREDANQTVSVAGLSSHHPRSVEEVMEMVVRGNEYRTMSPTEANATSSRSHAVLQINVALKDRNADISEPHTMATLSIIDLAGSERASATKNRGERLLEGANINKSLLALGSCINALCDPRKRNHVPYRNSKLTRLLKFSLGGNCKTVMIVCVSPSSAHFDETQNTLRYANRAKNIQTKVTRNVYNVNRHVKDFLKKIDEQMAMINELKAQQKDSEGVAFVKFRKQTEKREIISREGIARIRKSFDDSVSERQEKMSMMKRLRQLERRISLISAWVAGFDSICETRDEEEPPKNLVTMRKTAQGVLAELESSRQHYHQRLNKNNWERALDSALQTGIRQLKENDAHDGSDISSLIREAELLKSNADREMYTSILDQDKGGDAAVVQILLQSHFDTIAILNQILHMSEHDAVRTAKNMLAKIITACSTATSQVIKPEGGLSVTEVFPPNRHGTPKHRKPTVLLGPSPIKAISMPSFVDENSIFHSSSPMKASPRRVKLGGKKSIRVTPNKKSPAKAIRRGVRWRDDTEDGKLAEFQATPKPLEATPEMAASTEPPLAAPDFTSTGPSFSAGVRTSSSPIPTPPEPSLDLNRGARNNRFQTGFLSKKNDGSPLSQTGPTSTLLNFSDSDASPLSPLRELQLNRAPHSSSLHLSSTVTPPDSATNSGAEDENPPPQPPTHKSAYSIDQTEAKTIRSALKRSSSIRDSSSTTQPTRTQRRRSPTATSSGSPPSDNALFTASHARRMVKSDKGDDWKTSVLSPRTAPIGKGAPVRRTTMGGSGPVSSERVGSAGSEREGLVIGKGPVRMSAVGPGYAGPTVAAAVRSSLAPGGKGSWRG
ncbi:kinesin-domain-containing protein [Tothia fuscella]|uniref:Kinesin-domain-containing protein n=1 Tax=Tothia fuscella TaxID=1048955 RepID=A0A9P4NFL2_9PEZI|nr:kinesin-domain-containing protein [Tothia fuscella]